MPIATLQAPLLSNTFLSAYPSQPEHMNELAAFTLYRTYSRWVESEGKREEWKEIVRRSVEYNMSIGTKTMEDNGYPVDYASLKLEAEALFDNIFNTRQFLSGRTHWVGGADTSVADKFPLANFNCSFIDIVKWDDMADLFYLLLVGTGVGFRGSKEQIAALPPVNNAFRLTHEDYAGLQPASRAEYTSVNEIYKNPIHSTEPIIEKLEINVGDSKEGWVEAIRVFLKAIQNDQLENIHINYNSIRPNGERLKTFGGTASGHEPLRDMFEGIKNVITNTIDPNLAPLEPANKTNMVNVRPIHILDIGNLIGHNVVVGGVRRTAEIFLADEDDLEVILAKYGINGIWDESAHKTVCTKLQKEFGEVPAWLTDLPINDANARPLHHRRMSNNSIAFTRKPTRERLNLMFAIMQSEGEPGFVNLEAAGKRRPNAKGLNPCAEILLDSYGVCNLTTVNVMSFVKDGTLDFAGLAQAQALSARAGLRMTCVELELEHWNKVHQRDRLTGTSLTGWQDAMSALGYDAEQEGQLLNVLEEIVNDENMRYSTLLRIPLPVLSTTVKPEGTLSQVAGGVSNGIHHSHAPYFIRRIRINANDPLAEVAKNLNWNVVAEVGQELATARTLVVEFPVASGASKTKDDVYIDEQFDTYFRFQTHYTQHNTSNTIHVRPDEWERAEERVWDGWDDFVGVSFLSYDGGSYQLAPYETITEEQYDVMKADMIPFDVKYLHALESAKSEFDITDDSCATGACAVR